MFSRSVLLAILLVCTVTRIQSQTPTDTRIFLKDSLTKAPLSGKEIEVQVKNKLYHYQTDQHGIFLLPTNTGSTQIIISTEGYTTDSFYITSFRDSVSIVRLLKPRLTVLKEIFVKSQLLTRSDKKSFAGIQKLKVAEFNNIPVLFGEKDILKSIQTLPGIKNAGEGSSGLYIRGGSADQNLVLLDGATIYNPSHLLGFFSVFNSDILNDVTIYKGALPSEYGGRLSSVIDIKTNPGDTAAYKITGGIGLIASRIAAEGPIVKDRASFLFSVRKSYPDQYLALSKDPAIRNNTLHFTDYNGKLYWRLNKKNELFVNFYQGNDHFSLGKIFGIEYGNKINQLRWRHQFRRKLVSNTSIIYSTYKYNISLRPSNTNLYVYSDLYDYTIKQEFQKTKNETETVKFGFDITAHNIRPVSLEATMGSGFSSFDPEMKRNLEWNLYFSKSQKINDRTLINYGIRYNFFSIMGPGNYYSTDSLGNRYNYAYYKPFQIGKPEANPEPRISINYDIDETRVLKISYARNVQNIHMISNSTSANPTDLFLATNNTVHPEIADQVSLGYFSQTGNKTLELSAEIYYKDFQNQIDYKDGSQLLPNQDIETLLTFGKARAYGFEFLARKKKGVLTGWLSYTLSKTERRFSSINNNRWFNARQDRPHELSAVLIYQPNRRWTISSSWIYYSGSPVTFPSGKYRIGGQIFYYYTERNQKRMPDYHRLDLAVTYHMKSKKMRESSWTFSLYNAYNRENAYSITFEDDPTVSNKTNAMQTTLFKMVPSFTYHFKF